MTTLKLPPGVPPFSDFINHTKNYDTIAETLCLPGKSFIKDEDGKPLKILRSHRNLVASMWNEFSFANLSPNSHNFDINAAYTDSLWVKAYSLLSLLNWWIGQQIRNTWMKQLPTTTQPSEQQPSTPQSSEQQPPTVQPSEQPDALEISATG
ncbi:hypothetical protein VNO78_08488 [Psophocarpus tetragonolobus]|uniref:Uncharacterized protein n=1 Tax=Psophocarpus tetragonolobus TaxID=3891 RepID=A0AAN9XTF9_PSOTE